MGATKNSALHTHMEYKIMKKLKRPDLDFSIHPMERSFILNLHKQCYTINIIPLNKGSK